MTGPFDYILKAYLIVSINFIASLSIWPLTLSVARFVIIYSKRAPLLDKVCNEDLEMTCLNR
jgi:hypothetical protein